MKVTYCNNEDDLLFLLNKKVILHCKRDGVGYAGKIKMEHKFDSNDNYVDYLVFVGLCPQNCEITYNKKEKFIINSKGIEKIQIEPTFDEDVSMFKTAMYVGEGHKEFVFAIKQGDDSLFLEEWNDVYKKNLSQYEDRVKKRREEILNF